MMWYVATPTHEISDGKELSNHHNGMKEWYTFGLLPNAFETNEMICPLFRITIH